MNRVRQICLADGHDGCGGAHVDRCVVLALATAPTDASHAINLYDLHTGTPVGRCRGHKQGIWAVAFAPDGRTLASSSEDGRLKLWNVETQSELVSIPIEGPRVSTLMFSPGGEWLAAASGAYRFATGSELRLIAAPR